MTWVHLAISEEHSTKFSPSMVGELGAFSHFGWAYLVMFSAHGGRYECILAFQRSTSLISRCWVPLLYICDANIMVFSILVLVLSWYIMVLFSEICRVPCCIPMSHMWTGDCTVFLDSAEKTCIPPEIPYFRKKSPWDSLKWALKNWWPPCVCFTLFILFCLYACISYGFFACISLVAVVLVTFTTACIPFGIVILTDS